jgi:8-oxo-dGTP pyrophosphatase MutT (NUDIX family)
VTVDGSGLVRSGVRFRAMAYAGSYLWRLRQAVGHELVLMPGAMVAVQRNDGQVLLAKRADDGSWCLPAGGAEVGGSFARTAIDELAEETGIEVALEDLLPFASLSEAQEHTIHYPNGDATHCFALCFLARKWRGDPRPDREEVTEVVFAPPDAAPEPLHAPSARALELLCAYLETGVFQLR